ncbi:hypothetical protein CEXT_404771 [Caerostris extrusa]|uniref:Uncharacterized protein n=1 Tax=Caerostris extrusa TaxID=172846 RepID=A0AAV4SXS2_CAEEX|nr:hypothetical protein CEXT_404771 [Caerostris extrusa]
MDCGVVDCGSFSSCNGAIEEAVKYVLLKLRDIPAQRTLKKPNPLYYCAHYTAEVPYSGHLAAEVPYSGHYTAEVTYSGH